jgi:uncharacterized protein (TIGR00255 family)
MKSMTGFGRGEASANGITWSVEAASINRKQLEVVVGLPRELAEMEVQVRNEVSAIASRGRVQVTIRFDSPGGSNESLKVNRPLAAQYLAAAREMAAELNLTDELKLNDALRLPGVLDLQRTEVNAESAWPLIKAALDQALAQLIAMRSAEGANLKLDIMSRLSHIAAVLEQIRQRAGVVVEHHRRALHQRLAEAGLVIDLNDERLVKELLVFADRCDISEELARAASHLAQFEKYLGSSEPAGRSLDFLTQELFREFNTMGSKANHAELSHLVVEAKTEIEKIREQVQNIE